MIRKRVCSSILVTALGFGLILAAQPIRAEVDWKSKEAQALYEKQNIDYEITLARQALAAQQSSFEAQEAKLQELRENGKILDKEYKLLYKQLKNAKHEVKSAYARYDQALYALEKKQEEYGDRLLMMFENARPSTLSVLLSSSNIKGFFQGMELAGAVADRDLAVIQELSNAKSLAEILKSNAEITGAKAENFITQISEEIDKLEEGIRLEEETLQALELQVAQRSQGINELQYKGAVVDANIQRARDEIAYQDTLKKLQQDQPLQIEDQNMPLVPTETQIKPPKPSEMPSVTKRPQASEEVTEPEYIEGPQSPKPTNPPPPEPQAPPVETEAPAPSNPPPSPGVSLFFPNGFSQSITSPFGYRGSPINGAGEFHTGTDFQGSFDAPIFAAMGGTVIAANTPVGQGAQYGGWGYGNYIDIQHPNGWVTRYGHLMNVYVSVGQQVSAGEMIGGCGSTGASTGPHLHFEIIIDGRQVDPVPYLFG